jgi:hypothetical protein
MKNLTRIVLIMALAAGMVSCESIKGLFDVDFDTTLSGTLNVNVQEQVKKAVGYPFGTSAKMNPMDDPDIADYADKIVDVTAKGIVAEVVAVNKDNVVFYQGSSFTLWDNADSVYWEISEDWPIVVGTTLTLKDLGGAYDDVSTILSKKQEFYIKTQGTCSQTGVFIEIRIDIETTVTGNPL